jgi:hypothetical protein
MQTPAHLAASLFVWRKEIRWADAAAVVFGAVLPDITMFFFYGYQKAIGSTEKEIWGTLYFEEHWQYCFDVFNSIPIAILLFIVFRQLKIRWAQLLVASAGLHMLCDLPVHHDDGHRHFLPLSNWRFESPISYWDPAHYGYVFAAFELVLAISALIYVTRKGEKPAGRIAIAALAIYAAGIAILIFVFARPFFCGE